MYNGKENNYNIIFGATDQGSILYGKEQKDLTDIVLKELNEDYTTKIGKKENKKQEMTSLKEMSSLLSI